MQFKTFLTRVRIYGGNITMTSAEPAYSSAGGIGPATWETCGTITIAGGVVHTKRIGQVGPLGKDTGGLASGDNGSAIIYTVPKTLLDPSPR